MKNTKEDPLQRAIEDVSRYIQPPQQKSDKDSETEFDVKEFNRIAAEARRTFSDEDLARLNF